MAQLSTTVTITARDETAQAFNSVKSKLDSLHNTVSKFRGSLFGNIVGAGLALGAINEIGRAVRDTTRAIYDNTVHWQAWEYTLEGGGLTATQTQQELQFLSDTAEKLGLKIQDMGGAFSRFVLTGLATGFSLQELNTDFAAISEAMRIFHLSSQQAQRAWIALTEVMAVGKIRSRQYSQQLGRDWPGIGALVAQSLFPGTNSMKRFYEAMKEGKISAAQFMDAFQKVMATPAMQGSLTGAIGSIQAATGRLSDAWFALTNQAENTSALDSATHAINELAETLSDPNVKTGFDNLITGLATLATWVMKSGATVTNWLTAFGSGIGDVVVKIEGLPSGTENLVNDIARIKREIGDLQNQEINPFNSARIPYLQAQINEKEKELTALQFALAHPQLSPQRQAVAGAGTSAKPPLPPLQQLAPNNFNMPVSKKTVYEQYQESVQKFNVSLQKAIDLQAKFSEQITKSNTVNDTHQIAGAAEAMSLVNQQVDQSRQHIAQVTADIRMMVGSEVGGVVVTADMANKAIAQLQQKSDIAQKQLSAFGEQAARNIQDSLAKLFTNSEHSWRAWLLNLVRTFEQSMAQLVASKALNTLFGGFDKSGNNSGNAGLATIISTFFGGGKASGGDVSNSKFYVVGEHGPELFVPHSSGNIVNNSALQSMGRSQHFENNVNIDARGAGPDETAKLLAMRNDLLASMQSSTEFRLQRGSWRTARMNT